MNTTEHGSNFTSTSSHENVTLSNFTATAASATSWSPSFSSEGYKPEITIMVVLGLSLLLAGLAAFLAVCRPSQQQEGGDSQTSCSPGEGLAGGKGCSSEPQLKVWKRLGSYRRSCNLSFRRPPHRRPQERESARASLPQQALPPPPPPPAQGAGSAEPQLTVPCLFDYVTEI